MIRDEIDHEFLAEMAKVEGLVTAVRSGIRELAATIPQPPAKRLVLLGNQDTYTTDPLMCQCGDGLMEYEDGLCLDCHSAAVDYTITMYDATGRLP